MNLDPQSAGQALAAAQESRRRLAVAQAHWPWSRHAAFGLLLGGLSAVQAAPPPFNVAGDMALAFAGAGVAATDRRRRGVFVNGWRHGRTLWVALPVVLLAVGVGLYSLWLRRDGGHLWAPVALGAALVPGGAFASKVWEHVYRRELQENL